MKPSKRAELNYWLGLGVFLFAGILFFIYQRESAILYGLMGLNLLWLMGIQEDLYKKEVVA